MMKSRVIGASAVVVTLALLGLAISRTRRVRLGP
jgi:hypothetical protein